MALVSLLDDKIHVDYLLLVIKRALRVDLNKRITFVPVDRLDILEITDDQRMFIPLAGLLTELLVRHLAVVESVARNREFALAVAEPLFDDVCDVQVAFVRRNGYCRRSDLYVDKTLLVIEIGDFCDILFEVGFLVAAVLRK